MDEDSSSEDELIFAFELCESDYSFCSNFEIERPKNPIASNLEEKFNKNKLSIQKKRPISQITNYSPTYCFNRLNIKNDIYDSKIFYQEKYISHDIDVDHYMIPISKTQKLSPSISTNNNL